MVMKQTIFGSLRSCAMTPEDEMMRTICYIIAIMYILARFL